MGGNNPMMGFVVYLMMKKESPTTTGTGSTSTTLSSDWKYFHYTKKHYRLIAISKRNWDDAKNDCRSQGGDLASVTSKHENNFLKSLGIPATRAWIGGDSSDSGTTWTWSDGTTFGYENWPNDNSQGNDGGKINIQSNGVWRDDDGSGVLDYIC